MISGFTDWATAAQLIHTAPLEKLKNRRLGIEAEDYVKTLLTNAPTKEPLLPALGGLPFSLEQTVADHIGALRELSIEPFFVFNGLSNSGQDDRLRASLGAIPRIVSAWEMYNKSQPETAVAEFGTLCHIDMEHIVRYVQYLFQALGVDFIVAPYSAAAQLTSLLREQVIDYVVGPPEVLVFEVDKLITKLDFETREFSWTTRKDCIAELGSTSTARFVDACLLAGSPLLPTLPRLDASPLPNIKAAADLLRTSDVDGHALCLRFQDEPLMQSLNYLTRYRKAVASLKYHPVLSSSGVVEYLEPQNAPFDVHEFMAQRLPDELLGYLSHGIVGPQVLNWRATGEIVERPPLDGGDSDIYQRLITTSLTPVRSSSLALLSSSLNRFYQHKDVSLRTWADGGNTRPLGVTAADITESKREIAAWNVRLDQINDRATKLQRDIATFDFAVSSLDDAEFAKQTVTPKSNGFKPLSSPDEVRANVVWRFLQQRGYIKSDHTLSPIGKCLQSAYVKVDDKDLQEPVLIALELMRVKALNADPMFSYNGAPWRGSETDKRNTLLVSRVACLGALRHKSIGFTGPLSRHLLAYRDMVSVVRSSFRNLVEVNLANMLLDGNIDRHADPKSWARLSFSLPFFRDTDCALGIAVKSYLDEVSGLPEPASLEARNGTKEKGRREWFPHAVDFPGDLERAFRLWDAVFAAVREAPTEVAGVKDKKLWEEVDVWLADRR